MSDNSPIDAATEIAKTAKSFADLAKDWLSPTIAKRQTAAELYEMEEKIKFAKNHSEVEFVIREDGTPGFITSAEQEQAIRASRRLLAEAERHQDNLENVYMNAANDVDDINALPSESINDDWIARFNNNAQDISNKDMQLIWGKILSGEFNKPGSFSLRTLDVVKNISSDEAKVFQKVLPYVICYNNIAFVTVEKELLKQCDYSHGDLLRLDSCGLVQVIPYTQIVEEIESKKEKRCLYTNGMLLEMRNEESSDFHFSIDNVYLLTEAGISLFNLLGADSNDGFFEGWIDILVNKLKLKNLRFVLYQRTRDGKERHYASMPYKQFKYGDKKD